MLVRASAVCATILFLAGCNRLPPDARDAEVRVIQNLEQAWAQDYTTHALESVAGRYADDATWMLAGKPQINGRAAIREELKSFLADPNFAFELQSTRVEVSRLGDLAFSQGTYTLMRTDVTTQKPIADKGKFVLTYRKQSDGAWRVVACIFNRDAGVY
jgi:uncharacterized protein (TIGR02246 family)